jgi:tetratricopeptide (TPR) repeat protein
MPLALFSQWLAGFLLLFGTAVPANAEPDTVLFNALLRRGDSVYRMKEGYATFQKSLRYFDSARVLAEKSGDKELLGQATFARGRVYDAWTVEPLKTIELFTKATQLFGEAGLEDRYFYAKHLIAHTYDKMGDSAGAVKILKELVLEIAPKSAQWRAGEPVISELAVIATEIGNYALADTILGNLTRREWIANDPETYNWLDHYYLAQARLDLYYRGKKWSTYPDSFAQGYRRLSNIFDRTYYAQRLAPLWAIMGEYKQAYEFRTLAGEMGTQSRAGNDFERMQQALVASETASERRKVAYETATNKSRTRALWAVTALLAIITVLSIHLYRRNKKYKLQSQNLRKLNTELDQQAGKVILLNKEIQHRIKNNLYTIYSLLHMQQESTDNEEVIAHLEAARMRIEM